jgi:hypothetical protein
MKIRKFLACATVISAVALAALPASADEVGVTESPVIVGQSDAPPAPTPTPAPAKRSGRSERTRERQPLIELTLTPQQSFALGGDQLTPPGTVNDNGPQIAGDLYVRLAPKLRALGKRVIHYDVSGATFKKGKPSYSGFAIDNEYDWGLIYALNPQLSVTEEYIYRYRQCCPNAGDPANNKPRVEQGPRTEVTFATGPNTRIGRPLRFLAQATYVEHHADIGIGLPGGTPVQGKTWVSKLTAYLYLPVYGQSKVVPYFGVEHFNDFFNNQLVPSMTNRTVTGIQIRGTRFASYRAYVKNDHQTNPAGDVPHKVTLFLESSFRFHS